MKFYGSIGVVKRISGYPKKVATGWALMDFHGQSIGRGHLIKCTRIRPGAPGSWISDKRCSYRFKVEGAWYSGRSYGEGMLFTGREMKSPLRRAR